MDLGQPAPQACIDESPQELGQTYGIALDGDADRLQLIDTNGQFVQRSQSTLPGSEGSSLNAGLTSSWRSRVPLMTNFAIENSF
jgi:hypothetical protein